MSVARTRPFGPADFSLDDGKNLPLVGVAIMEKFKSWSGYEPDAPEAEEAELLDHFLKWMMCKVTTVDLLTAGRYGGQTVTWIPGHVVGDRMSYGPDSTADIMVIGKMPGKLEAEQSRFWVGPAGKLLAKELGYRGINLTDCYGTNVTKFAMPYPNMKAPPAAWVKEGAWFLRQEIRIVKPKFILILGADALKAVVGKSATIKRYRGLVTPHEGAQLLVTNNPADLLRNPENMDVFRQDLDLFKKVVHGESTEAAPVDYHYLRTAAELQAVVDACMKYKVFAIDCEWNGEKRTEGHLLTIQFSCKEHQAFVVVIRSDVGRTEFSPSPSAAIQILKPLLARPDVVIVGHNFRADLKWLVELGIDLTRQFAINGFDTMLAHHLIIENAKHSLTDCALTDTDMGRYDEEVQRLMAEDGLIHWTIPEDVLLPYAAADADATFRLYKKYRKTLWVDHTKMCKEQGLDPHEAFQPPESDYAQEHGWVPSSLNLLKSIVMPVNIAISEMEREGLGGDLELIDRLAKVFAKKRDSILADLRSMIHNPTFNPRSPQQSQRLLFGKPGSEDKHGRVTTCLGLTPVKTTGKRAKRWAECVVDEEVEYLEEPTYKMVDGESVMDKPAGWASDRHAPSTDAESLAVLWEDHGCEEARVMANFRVIDQICKNFLTPREMVQGEMVFLGGLGGHLQRDGRIRTTFSQLTETGRYRSSDPNMQNLPKGREGDIAKLFSKDDNVPPIRTCIVAADDYVFVEADLVAAELHTLAALAGDDKMKADLAKKTPEGVPISLHTTQAINIFRLDMSPVEFDIAREVGDKEAKRLGGLRVAAKSVNFGIPYQRGAKAIALQVQREGVECTDQDAQGWIDSFYDDYKKVGAFIEACKASVHDPGWLRTPFGRVKYFHDSSEQSAMAAQEREACNFPIQSTVADSLSTALLFIERERTLRQMKFRLVLMVHDSVLLEVPYGEVQEVKEILHLCMVERLVVPGIGLRYGIDIEVSRRWNEKLTNVKILKACGLWEEANNERG